MKKDICDGYLLDLGKSPDLWSAIGSVVIQIDETRKSLVDLAKQANDRTVYFVEEIKHGAPIIEILDATRSQLTDCVLVFHRAENRWGIVTKQWFDSEMTQEEPVAASGSIESGISPIAPPPTSEQPVVLSPSIELERKKAQ